jgi:hypothetical protein
MIAARRSLPNDRTPCYRDVKARNRVVKSRSRCYIDGMRTGLQKALKILGGYSALARELGIDRNAIRRWHSVPDRWIIKIEHLTGVPREELRPDLYLAPRPKKRSYP